MSGTDNEFADLWQSLSTSQQKYAIARAGGYSSDAAAAKSVGISASTVRNWDAKPKVDRAVFLMISNQRDAAMSMLESALPKAVEVLLDCLADPKTPRIRELAAIDVLDRCMGKSIQRVSPVMPNGLDPYVSSVLPAIDDHFLARVEEILAIGRQRRLAAQVQVADVTSEYLDAALTLDQAAEDHEG